MSHSDDLVRMEIRALQNKLAELEGGINLLLAFRLISDGHEPTLKAAMKRVRTDRDGVVELYR